MTEVQKIIKTGDRFYNLGNWDKAESCYESAIQICDFSINLQRRDRNTLKLLEYKVEAVSRMAEIAESMHREDDAERLSQLCREIIDYLRSKMNLE